MKKQCRKVFFQLEFIPNSISENIDAQFFWLRETAVSKNCVAIGECGLDGLIEIEEKLQEEVFERQIILANEIKKPLIIHCVRRFSRLNQLKKLAKVPVIIHGFNKRRTIGEDLRRKDFYLSFGKSALYNVDLQQFLRDFPMERILLETNSADFKIEELYKKAALIKNVQIIDLVQIIRENLQKLQILK